MFGEVAGERLLADHLGWTSATVAELEMTKVGGLPRTMEGVIAPAGDAEVNGIAGWFDVEMGAGVRFDTGPRSPETHWAPLYFPFAEPMQVRAGKAVRVRFWPVQTDVVHTRWRWWAGDGESSREGDDLTLLAYLKRPLAPCSLS